MKAKEFKKDDEGFMAWRNANPDGFILNLPYAAARDHREYYLDAVKLHLATCPCLQPDKNGEKPWSTNEYFKVCAMNSDDIIMWFDRHADKPSDWELPRCKRPTCR